MTRVKTLRGVIPDGSQTLDIPNVATGDPIRLCIDNSNLNRNYRITKFEVFPNMDVTDRGYYCSAVGTQRGLYVTVCTQDDATRVSGAFNKNRQIGWAVGYSHSDSTNYRSFTDPNHIIVEDLWLGFYMIDHSNGAVEQLNIPVNYHIEIEHISSTDEEAIMQLIKENAQDV